MVVNTPGLFHVTRAGNEFLLLFVFDFCLLHFVLWHVGALCVLQRLALHLISHVLNTGFVGLLVRRVTLFADLVINAVVVGFVDQLDFGYFGLK